MADLCNVLASNNVVITKVITVSHLKKYMHPKGGHTKSCIEPYMSWDPTLNQWLNELYISRNNSQLDDVGAGFKEQQAAS